MVVHRQPSREERGLPTSRLTSHQQFTGDRAKLIEAVRDALYASKIMSYAQGFVQLGAAGKQYGWELNFGDKGDTVMYATRIEAVAAAFGGYWEPYAKAFYAAQAMGVAERSHDAMFRAVHVDRSLPVQPLPTDEQLGQFYAQFGVDPKQFASTMSSFAVKAKMNQAGQFLQRSGVDSTPVLIVDGKYRVTGRSHEENLRIAEHLVAMERAADAGAAPSAPADGASAD